MRFNRDVNASSNIWLVASAAIKGEDRPAHLARPPVEDALD